MSNTSTHDFLAREEEADFWLSVFDKLPDAIFSRRTNTPSQNVVNNIKAFARAYHPVKILRGEEGIVIN